MWASFEIYRLFNKPATPSVPASVSAPLSPTLDQSVINKIQSRIYLDDAQIPDNVIGPVTGSISLPEPSPSPVPETEPANETNESSPVPEPESATGSGESN